jgi:hypothetical protein
MISFVFQPAGFLISDFDLLLSNHQIAKRAFGSGGTVSDVVKN